MISHLYFILLMSVIHQPSESKSYSVKKIQTDLVINGKGDSPLWKAAIELTDFTYPWEKESPPSTSFRALHGKDWLYLLYRVKDDNVIIYEEKHNKDDVLNCDRAEIFFRHDQNMSPYFGLEMDPIGRVYDYKAASKRNVDGTWSWPAGQLIIKTSRTTEGYIVEVAISKGSLNEFGLIKGNTIQAGLYRGNCVKIAGNLATFKWISWVKPDSTTPDFHVPSSFGVLLLED